MSLQCDKCGKSYPTNASLYQHKHLAHPKPKLMLVNHSHDGSKSSKRPRSYNLPHPKPKKREMLPPVTKQDQPREKPRDYEIKPNPDPQKYDGQDDKGLKVVDSYGDDEQGDDGLRVVDSYDDGQGDDGLRVVDSYDDDSQGDGQLKIIDSYDDDGQSDSNLTVIDSFNTPNYKALYEDCLKSKKDIKKGCQQKLDNIRRKHEEKISDLKESYRGRLREFGDKMKEEYEERIEKMRDVHGKAVQTLQGAHDKVMKDYEQNCKRKIKLLSDQLQAVKDDDEDLSNLAKIIFNCTTMEEIFQIQKLVKNHQIDELVQKHLPTLQNLFLSLSFGVLPICQPQRDQVTDEQRRVVEQLQVASQSSAKNILKNKRGEVINLFTIISDSIKLARDAYSRYGTSM